MRFRRRPSIDTKELQENWQPLLYIRLAVVIVLVAYVVGFILENRKAIKVHFVLTSAHVSLVWLILLSLGLGFVAGILLSQLERRSRRRRAAKQAR